MLERATKQINKSSKVKLELLLRLLCSELSSQVGNTLPVTFDTGSLLLRCPQMSLCLQAAFRRPREPDPEPREESRTGSSAVYRSTKMNHSRGLKSAPLI